MMKRCIAGWLTLFFLALGLPAQDIAKAGAPGDAPVVIGTSTAPDGHLGLGLWSDNAADTDLRLLLHGYETVSWASSLGIAFNKAVLRNVYEKPQADGDIVVTFELKPGLAYNNGEPITARDYVFSLLLLASPQIAALGAKPDRLEYLRGYEAYHSGAAAVLEGVRLLSDTSFSMRVQAETLPDFYGFAWLKAQPYPISVIAPGCRVADDGQGAYIQNAADAVHDGSLGYAPGRFSAEMLAVTLLDPAEGYEANPRVTCGPYQLAHHDAAARTVRLQLNERYIGNYEGIKPTVERLEVRYAHPDQMIPLLQSGALDVAARVSDKDAIRRGRASVEQGEGMRAVKYPRTGQTMLAFACERGPLASGAVRKAVALSLDKDEIARQIGGEHAQRVYGYYGKDQWMPEYVSDPGDGGPPLDMQRELARLDIPQDLARAKALLEADGWTLNSRGDPFREGVDPVRYRADGGQLVPLALSMALPEESNQALRISGMLAESLRLTGIGLYSVPMPFNDMLAHLYQHQGRTFDLFFLSNNFAFLFDPSYELNPGEAMQGIANKTGIRDEELEALARGLRATPALDKDAYAVKWLAFQARFMEVLPVLPLYSSTYFDFYTDRLLVYTADQHSGWALSVPYMRMR